MKHAAIDKARLKAAVDAIKDQERPDGHQLGLAQQARMAQFRRKLGKELRPLFTGARFDVGTLDKALVRHQVEMREALKKDTAKTAKGFAKVARDRERGIANTERALRHIATKPLLTTLIPITTPYLIYATPIGMLRDSHVEPWNNFAKFSYTSDRDTGYDTAVVKFFFAWQNPSDYLAVINCNTNLLINGIVEATAEQGWVTPGSAFVELWAKLRVYVGSTVINYQGSQQQQMATVYAEGGYALFGGSGDIKSENVFGAYNLSCSDIQVDGDQLVVFEVACSADWWIDGGSIVLAFDFDPARRWVACPVLNVELLTEPQGSVVMPPASSTRSPGR